MTVPAPASRLALVLSAWILQACILAPDGPPGPAAGGTASPLVVPDSIPVEMEDGSVVEMDLEEYLKGVLPKEMGSSFPMEALKAQAVAARNFALDYTRTGRAICTTTLCQAWGPDHQEATDAAVEATRGVVATVDDRIVPIFFSASCGGHTRNVEDVWHGDPLSWLRGVPCIENKSEACEITCTPDVPAGTDCWGVFGHRVGLCQRGAQAMADCGSGYEEILEHYLAGIVLVGAPAPADGLESDEANAGEPSSDLAMPDEGPGEATGTDEAGEDDAPADTPVGETFVPPDAHPSTDPDNAPWGCNASARGTGGSPRGPAASSAALLLVAFALAASARRRNVSPM